MHSHPDPWDDVGETVSWPDPSMCRPCGAYGTRSPDTSDHANPSCGAGPSLPVLKYRTVAASGVTPVLGIASARLAYGKQTPSRYLADPSAREPVAKLDFPRNLVGGQHALTVLDQGACLEPRARCGFDERLHDALEP